MIDLNKGEIVYRQKTGPGESIFLIQTLMKEEEFFYFFLQCFSEDNDNDSLVLRIDRESGLFTGVHSYDYSLNSDQRSWHLLANYILNGYPELITWNEISEELKQKLMNDPGLTEDMFE